MGHGWASFALSLMVRRSEKESNSTTAPLLRVANYVLGPRADWTALANPRLHKKTSPESRVQRPIIACGPVAAFPLATSHIPRYEVRTVQSDLLSLSCEGEHTPYRLSAASGPVCWHHRINPTFSPSILF